MAALVCRYPLRVAVMSRYSSACVLQVVALVVLSPCAVSCAEKPNIVFFFIDDLGWTDVGYMYQYLGRDQQYYETPHIDRIGREGMRFRQGYATCQVCSPSRASIVTGQFPARHGITSWIGDAAQQQWKRNTILLPAAYDRALSSDHVLGG